MAIKTFTGDYAKANEGSTYQVGPDGNYLAGAAQADAPDMLNGSSAADWLQGAGTAELARGISWVAYRNPGARYVNGDPILRHVQAAGAGLGAVFQGLEDGLYYIESTGNVIDGGAGADYIAAGTADDIVYGGQAFQAAKLYRQVQEHCCGGDAANKEPRRLAA